MMFDSMDLKETGVKTFNEWLKFCFDHIVAKTASMDPHHIFDQGNMEQFKEFLKTAVQPELVGTPRCFGYCSIVSLTTTQKRMLS